MRKNQYPKINLLYPKIDNQLQDTTGSLIKKFKKFDEETKYELLITKKISNKVYLYRAEY